MYYPKSQIKENLYTNGTEYYLSSTGQSYTGYYYELSNGKRYTGKTSLGSGGILLTRLSGNPTNLNITTEDIEGNSPEILQSAYVKNYNNTPVIPRSIPSPYKSTISGEDIAQGEYKRYFVKKNNEFIYYEITPLDFNLLQTQSPDIAFNLFSSVELTWILISANSISRANKKTVELIEKKYNWFGFVNSFQNNFSYGGSPQPSYLETKGGEFVLPNRRNYIGFYHQMDDGNFMTGKYHGEGQDIPLISLNNAPLNINTPAGTLSSIPPPNLSSREGGY